MDKIRPVFDPADFRNKLVSDKGFQAVRLSGNPTVLVVDDEELIREVASIVVEDYGGQALTAADGPKAVEMFREHNQHIDVVVMDFSMPGMNGYEVYKEMMNIRPATPFVFVSGLKRTPEIDALVREGKTGFVSKPFHEIELVKAISSVLER